MRFSAFLPTLALLSTALFGIADAKSSLRKVSRTTAPSLNLDTRSPNHQGNLARALVGVTACVTVAAGADVTVVTPNTVAPSLVNGLLSILANIAETPNTQVVLNEQLCLCVANGLVTQASLNTLQAALVNSLTARATVLGISVNRLLTSLGISLADLDLLVANALVQVLPAPTNGSSDTTCQGPGPGLFPTQGSFEPTTCGTCDFVCVAPTPFRCQGQCQATPCPSGVPQRRSARNFDANLLCGSGLTACAIPGTMASMSGRVECLNTKTNVETCGGCALPLPGQPKGTDCTALKNVSEVTCEAGRCIIQACETGYVSVKGACVAE